MGWPQPTASVTSSSDVLNVTGLDGTLHVIEMTYDDSGFANYQEETDQAALELVRCYVGGVLAQCRAR